MGKRGRHGPDSQPPTKKKQQVPMVSEWLPLTGPRIHFLWGNERPNSSRLALFDSVRKPALSQKYLSAARQAQPMGIIPNQPPTRTGKVATNSGGAFLPHHSSFLSPSLSLLSPNYPFLPIVIPLFWLPFVTSISSITISPLPHWFYRRRRVIDSLRRL